MKPRCVPRGVLVLPCVTNYNCYAQGICSDPIKHARVLKSYELMLDFYGMKLKDKETGLYFGYCRPFHLGARTFTSHSHYPNFRSACYKLFIHLLLTPYQSSVYSTQVKLKGLITGRNASAI